MKKQETNDGYIILNAQGRLWTPRWFATHTDAHAHIRDVVKAHGWDLSKHTVVPARFTVKWTAVSSEK